MRVVFPAEAYISHGTTPWEKIWRTGGTPRGKNSHDSRGHASYVATFQMRSTPKRLQFANLNMAQYRIKIVDYSDELYPLFTR